MKVLIAYKGTTPNSRKIIESFKSYTPISQNSYLILELSKKKKIWISNEMVMKVIV